MRENAIVEKSFAFSVRIVDLHKYLQQKKEFTISNQIYKSGTSIGANVAEAQRVQSRADFLSKLSIALKEANETQYWLKLLYASKYLSHREFESIHSDLAEILSLLTSICKRVAATKDNNLEFIIHNSIRGDLLCLTSQLPLISMFRTRSALARPC